MANKAQFSQKSDTKKVVSGKQRREQMKKKRQAKREQTNGGITPITIKTP